MASFSIDLDGFFIRYSHTSFSVVLNQLFGKTASGAIKVLYSGYFDLSNSTTCTPSERSTYTDFSYSTIACLVATI
jgi:hypothetical protein